jgi:NAD(P)-dependent dehydrogenase (short-subunit alcohol dehydrogenase family)
VTFDLRGKGIVVTGGSSGIGLGIACAVAAAGAGVCLWGRDEKRLRSAAEEVEEVAVHGTAVATEVVDVVDEAAVVDGFAAAVATLGRVDGCFANAGVSGVAPSFMRLELDEWRWVIEVNLTGAFLTMREAARHMVEAGGGSIVATGSRLAASGQPRAQHYSASKGGLVSMVRATAKELGPNGVRVNLIAPGWIDTPMTGPVIDKPRVAEAVLPRIPAGRWGTPDDIGALAVYLVSDGSAYHTGEVFTVDGGYGIV